MTEEQIKLLRISYSNNLSLLEIDKKIRLNKEKVEELDYIFNLRDTKTTWNMTTINMVLCSGLMSLLAQGTLKLQKPSAAFMFGGLSVASIACGINGRKTEEKYQEVVKKSILQKYEMDEINQYTYMQYNDTLQELENLKKLRNQITSQENLIKGELENVKELTK